MRRAAGRTRIWGRGAGGVEDMELAGVTGLAGIAGTGARSRCSTARRARSIRARLGEGGESDNQGVEDFGEAWLGVPGCCVHGPCIVRPGNFVRTLGPPDGCRFKVCWGILLLACRGAGCGPDDGSGLDSGQPAVLSVRLYECKPVVSKSLHAKSAPQVRRV